MTVIQSQGTESNASKPTGTGNPGQPTTGGAVGPMPQNQSQPPFQSSSFKQNEPGKGGFGGSNVNQSDLGASAMMKQSVVMTD